MIYIRRISGYLDKLAFIFSDHFSQDVEGNKVTIQRSLAAMKIAFKAEQQR